MSNPTPTQFPKTGVEFVALGTQQYIQALQQIATATATTQKALVSFAAAINTASAATGAGITSINQAIAAMNAATPQLIISQAQIQQSLNSMTAQMAALIAQLQQYIALLPQVKPPPQVGGGGGGGGGTGSFLREARGARLAGLELVFALQLLQTSLGEQLPQAAREAEKGLNLVVTGMLAGAYIAGPAGAAVGALAGGILALGVAALTADPNIAALNTELDKLGKKDDAASGLALLSGATYDQSQAALDFAKKHQDAAVGLKKLTDQSQASIPVLSGLGDAIGKPLGTLNILAQLYVADAQAALAFDETLKDTGNLSLAATAAFGALRDSITGTTAAIRAGRQALGEYVQGLSQLAGGKAGGAAGIDLSVIARGIGTQLRDIQEQYQSDLQTAAEDHQQRMADIAQQGAQRRIEIERNYAQRIADINEQLQQELVDAASDYVTRVADAQASAAQRLADLQANLQQRIQDIQEQHNDRRIAVEQQYQDRLKQIQDQYALSFFEAESRRDAKGIIQARLARDKQLEDAKHQKEREDKSNEESLERERRRAQEAYERQRRDLEQALAKQLQALQQQYEKRIRDLEQQAQREKQRADQDKTRQLQDQQRQEAQQEQSEAQSYARRQRELQRSLNTRYQSIARNLADTKSITDKYGIDIIKSLEHILRPEQITELIRRFHQAIRARIDIRVVPFVPEGEAQPRQYGGLTTSPTLAMLSERSQPELTLPLAHPSITQNLINNYLPASYSLPSMGGVRSGARQVEVKVTGDIKLNEPMLDGKILVIVDGHVAHVFDSVTGKLP